MIRGLDMDRPFVKLAVLGFSFFIWTAICDADMGLHPRAIGMGGAYTALARDIESPGWNPANLGLSDGRRFTLSLLGTGAAIKNNSLSIAEYNRYSGKLLSENDKEIIINSIPASGMTIDLGAEASAFNFSIGNFAITQRAFGSSSLNVDRDPLRLMLLGNAVLREVKVSDTRGESYAFADMAASYGHAVRSWQGGEISLGASFHYLRGLAYGKVVEARGGVSTTDTGFVGDGLLRIRTSYGGHGYAIDIGGAMRFEGNWYFSAAWKNLVAKANWNGNNEEYLTWFVMRPITLEDFFLEGQSDSLVTSGDTSYSAPGFSSRPSPSLALGLARKLRMITWSVDWHQALFSEPGVNVNPRLAFGMEYIPWLFMPVRSGIAFGGGQGTTYSVGFGLYHGSFHFDLGLANSGSPLPASSKGLRLAVAMGLYFQ